MKKEIELGGRKIGQDYPTYIVAELSANHNQNFDTAVKMIEAAKACGAHAVKLQTYTPDTLTIDCDRSYFRIKGTLWSDMNLYELYRRAYTPWEWQSQLKQKADEIGIDFFSTPFDDTAVDFLEEINVPVYKIASFELVDIPLLKKVACTGKPVIMSTGMASLAEIDEAVTALRDGGCHSIVLLKCTSAYPAPAEEMNLKAISHLAESFQVPVGLSDHTMGNAVPIAAVALGACVIEKHFTLSRKEKSPDSEFSLEPDEFKAMVSAVGTAQKAIGGVNYALSEKQKATALLRRSLFIVRDLKKGDTLTPENMRSIRPGNGLHTRYYSTLLGKSVNADVPRGTPLSWELIG